MARSPRIAIEIGRRRVRALCADFAHGRVTVRGLMAESIPEDLGLANPENLGAWIGDRLRAAGIGRGRAVISLPRDLVAFKRIILPTTDRDELADMTRMAMQRDLPIDAAGMVIDFVPVDENGTSTTVIAVAAPQSLLDSIQQTARAAGVVVERIGLSAMGAAALANNAANGGPALIVDVSGECVEITLIAGGQVSLSRCGEIPAPGDLLAVAEGVLTETRRTWMTVSLSDGAATVDSVLLMGDAKVCEYVAEPVSQMLGKPVHAVADTAPVAADGVALDHVWPMAGMLLEHHGPKERLNLAKPRRAPDIASITRRRGLLAAGVLLVVAMGLYTLANRNMKSLRETATELSGAVAAGSMEEARYSRDTYKLKHLQLWQQARVDWLEHAEYLSRFSPPPDQLVLDSWTGTLAFNGVTWSKPNVWDAPRQMSIVIDGEARDRETADALREALVKNSVYTTSSTGADAKGGKRMPFGFTYRLRTAEDIPQQHATSNEKPATPTSEVASR